MISLTRHPQRWTALIIDCRELDRKFYLPGAKKNAANLLCTLRAWHA
jgi:hypothetical protein